MWDDMTEPSRSESTRSQIEMAEALLGAMRAGDVIDLRSGLPTLDELLDALVCTRLRLVRDPQAIAPEALAAATPQDGLSSRSPEPIAAPSGLNQIFSIED
jgi:hypothetical protein